MRPHMLCMVCTSFLMEKSHFPLGIGGSGCLYSTEEAYCTIFRIWGRTPVRQYSAGQTLEHALHIARIIQASILVAHHDYGAVESGQRSQGTSCESSELDRSLASNRCCTKVCFESLV